MRLGSDSGEIGPGSYVVNLLTVLLIVLVHVAVLLFAYFSKTEVVQSKLSEITIEIDESPAYGSAGQGVLQADLPLKQLALEPEPVQEPVPELPPAPEPEPEPEPEPPPVALPKPAARPAPTPALPRPALPKASPSPPIASPAQRALAPPTATAPSSSTVPGAEVGRVVDADYKAAYLHNPKPPYPARALKMRIEGTVVLRVLVLEDGATGKIVLNKSSGNDSLDQSALATVAQWKFTPAQSQGKKIAQWVSIPIHFSLKRR